MTPNQIEHAPEEILSPCPECNDKRRVHSGAMVVHPPGLVPLGNAPVKHGPPVLLLHPTIKKRLDTITAADVLTASPRDRLVMSMISAGEVRVEVSEHVPLWIDCRTCCEPKVEA